MTIKLHWNRTVYFLLIKMFFRQQFLLLKILLYNGPLLTHSLLFSTLISLILCYFILFCFSIFNNANILDYYVKYNALWLCIYIGQLTTAPVLRVIVCGSLQGKHFTLKIIPIGLNRRKKTITHAFNVIVATF